MLTADFDRVGIAVGDLVADLGCGGGRHTFELLARGAHTLSVDINDGVLKDVSGMVAAMRADNQITDTTLHASVNGSALALPFQSGSLNGLIASEVLEHIPNDEDAMSEIARVVRPGGWVVATVPRAWPEKICWALSSDYHSEAGGHVRIYRKRELIDRLGGAGLRLRSHHYAHALHSPLWWLKCAFGINNDAAKIPSLYHRFLVWDITRGSAWVRRVEGALDPVMGKSLVVYAEKPSAQI
ncbi:MAG: class I SAM-dependent methyltransferase [Actinomycetota bacterium]|nr:class I SAM-dependent methyltransferase [Actinomycetota bacterium]